jgi:hypothetical protein
MLTGVMASSRFATSGKVRHHILNLPGHLAHQRQ